MAKPRSPNRNKAFEIYKKHKGNITNKEIATMLNEDKKTIAAWKCRDKWKEKIKKKVGAPTGNKNAIGNNGGAPLGNVNRFTYGNYSKRIPLAVKNIMKELDKEDPLEKLWRSICLQEARIIYMQKIMHVKNKNDINKELKREKESSGTNSDGWEKEYEIQFAGDREATLINTQSNALNTLEKLIKRYDDMLHANWNLATEEQKIRIEKIRADVDKARGNNGNNEAKTWADRIQEIAAKRRGNNE